MAPVPLRMSGLLRAPVPTTEGAGAAVGSRDSDGAGTADGVAATEGAVATEGASAVEDDVVSASEKWPVSPFL